MRIIVIQRAADLRSPHRDVLLLFSGGSSGVLRVHRRPTYGLEGGSLVHEVGHLRLLAR